MAERSNEAVQAFADGFFEILGALLSSPVTFELDSARPATREEAAQALEQRPVVVQARAREGHAVALLLELKDALRVAGTVFGTSAAADRRLAEHDLATLTELGQHAMQRAFERVGETAALTLTLDEVKVSLNGPLSAQRLEPVLAAEAMMAGVRFHAPPDLDVEAVLLFPGAWRLGEAEPVAAAEAEPPLAPEPEEPQPEPQSEPEAVPAEWDEILEQLNPRKEQGMAPETPNPAPVRPAATAVAPTNLDMVLDIRLVVRARLGRIEMPIGDILGLGPGSIVEVGRMLDEPVELLVNDKLIARGDVVVVDEKFGLRITEIVSPRERIESLR